MVKAIKYTPILKWKFAERGALSDLTDIQRSSIVPVFEFVRPLELTEKDKKDGIRSPEDKLIDILSSSIPNDIALSWGDGRLFFADFTLIFPENLRVDFARKFFANSAKIHLEFAPVLNLSADSKAYHQQIVRISREHSLYGVCLRVNSIEMQNVEAVNSYIDRFATEYKYNKKHISVLIDLKENVSLDTYKTASGYIQRLDAAKDFSHLILAGGAFPEDMTKFKIDAAVNSCNRDDWIGWNTHARESSTRVPFYGDYTIRYPIYNESVLMHPPSATIKYTLPDKWKIYRGKAKENENYLANASLLIQQNEFKQYGANFSAGDKFIDEKGRYFDEYIRLKNRNPDKKIGGTGNTTQWLRTGINHHIAVVVDQLSNLPD